MSVNLGKRYQGRIIEWNQEKGFGFIMPRGSKPPDPVVFVAMRAFRSRNAVPQIGDQVVYELLPEENKPNSSSYRTKLRATAVTFEGEPRIEDYDSTPVIGVRVFALIFVVSLVTAATFFRPAVYVSIVVITLSIVAILTYWWDKRAAARGDRRTPERELHLIALLGGWPGATLAQQVFRHKTQKPRFQRTFKELVVINVCATALFLWVAYQYHLWQ